MGTVSNLVAEIQAAGGGSPALPGFPSELTAGPSKFGPPRICNCGGCSICRDRVARKRHRDRWTPEKREQEAAKNKARKSLRRHLDAAQVLTRRGVPCEPDHLLILYGDPCAYCGRRNVNGRATTVDHIVPIDHGGNSQWENLTASCLECNGAKTTIPLLWFLLVRAHGKIVFEERQIVYPPFDASPIDRFLEEAS